MIEQSVTEDNSAAEYIIGEQEGSELGALALLSSLLFVSAKPVTTEALAGVLKLDVALVEKMLEDVKQLYSDEVHGFSLHEVAGGWQLRSSALASKAIRRLIPPKGKKLSRAAAETLAVIAYKQPVERSEIEGIRGVDVLPTLKTLLDAKLVRVVGRQDTAGQPALYGTTVVFLEKFGLRDLSELPSSRELDEFIEEPGESDTQVAQAEPVDE